MARVDILIPAYNAATTLREAAESALAQTERDIRIVIVNDGSTDETGAIAADLARADGRVHVVTTLNQGIVEARNEALKHATAEFIACLDSDDVAFPDRIGRELAYLAEHPECVAVGSAVEHVDEHGAVLAGMTQPQSPDDADPAKAPALEPYIIQSTLMARRAHVEAVRGYRHVPNSEDSDLFWRLAERGKLVNLTEKLGRYRVHTASVSSSIINGRIMAIGSQLGAMSALRRRAGKPDITFTYAMHQALKAAKTLEAMHAIAAQLLDAGEAEHLRVAASAKLMELAGYRPYELDAGDCAFVRASLPFARRLTAQNQKELDWYVTRTAGRLVRKGRLSEALTLTPPKQYPVAVARALLQR